MDQTTIPPGQDQDREPLCDEQGPIPTFPPAKLDERGRIIPFSPEERKARSEAARRVLKLLREQTEADPPGSDEEFMRGIDSDRPEGARLFEGYY